MPLKIKLWRGGAMYHVEYMAINPTWFMGTGHNYMHYVYILRSKKSAKTYTGRTDNLKRRFREHQVGGVWTTKRMQPVELIFYEAFLSKKDSIRRERYLKTTKGKSSLKQILRESLK